MPIPDFTVFATRSNAGKVAAAIVALLLADSELAAFTGSRIYRTSGLIVDREMPFMVVRPALEARAFELQHESEVGLRVAIGLVYDEHRTILAVSDKSLEEWFNALVRVLVANAKLENTSFGAAALVERIESFEAMDLQPLRENSDESVTVMQDVVVNYIYRVDATSGALV